MTSQPALPPLLAKRYQDIICNPPNWVAMNETSLFVPRTDDFTTIIHEFIDLQSDLKALREQWIATDRRYDLNLLLGLSLDNFMTRHISATLGQDLIDISLENEFACCSYLKHINTHDYGARRLKLVQAQTDHNKDEQLDPWDENLEDRVNDEFSTIKDRFASLDFLLLSLYWNTFGLTGIDYGNQMLALDFWTRIISGKVDAQLFQSETPRAFKSFLEANIKRLYDKQSPTSENDDFWGLFKAIKSNNYEDLRGTMRISWDSWLEKASSELIPPEDWDRWTQWQMDYFENREARAQYLSNLSQALRSHSESTILDSGALQTQSHGFVYFVRNGDLYKIGITQNLLARMSQIKPDEVLNVIRCANFREIEKTLHSRFKDVRVPQTEYFRLTLVQVDQVHQLLAGQSQYL
jgi:hypothetical protein